MLCSKIMLDLFYKLLSVRHDASVFWAGLLAAGFFATELISAPLFQGRPQGSPLCQTISNHPIKTLQNPLSFKRWPAPSARQLVYNGLT
jgi:hypothetical protein